MKLYKVDFKNAIGNNVVTVPTDSEFLVGLGNGDSTSTAKLFDGETELSAMSDKIGDYTCFRFSTGGTPFRAQYRGVISGERTELETLWVFSFDEVDYQGYTSIALALPDDINVADLVYAEGQDPVLTSFQTYVYGMTLSPAASYHYIKTITWTWNAEKYGFETTEDFGGTGNFKYIQFSVCEENYIYLGYGLESPTEGEGEYDEKKEIEVPLGPYSQDISLMVICQKQSVAYRDLEGSPEDIVEAVEDSGKFLEKTKVGQYDFYVPDASIMMADNKGISLTGGELSLSLSEESGGASVLTLSPNAETEEVDADGTIKGNGGSLTIKDTILANCEIHLDGKLYEPTRLTINGTTYLVLAALAD